MRTTFKGSLPSTSSRNLPGLAASKLRQLRPSRRHCPLRRGSAPPSRQVVTRPVPPSGPVSTRLTRRRCLPRRSNWAPHTPLHTMLLQVNRTLPQHPDGHARPLCPVIPMPPRSRDLRARLWPAPAESTASHLPCSPRLPRRLQFSAQAHAALAQTNAAAASSRRFAQAQCPNAPCSRPGGSLRLRLS